MICKKHGVVDKDALGNVWEEAFCPYCEEELDALEVEKLEEKM